jgi:crossover junction endodeoxyribonuclease RusA
MGSLLIELSWPSEELSPNARVHHMVKHRHAKAAKIEAGWATKIAGYMNFAADRYDVHIKAYPPSNRNRDADNLIASLKPHLDGIAEVLGVNDSMFNAPTLEWCDLSHKGRIVIRLSEAR